MIGSASPAPPVTVTVVGVVLIAIFYGGGGWFFSSLLFNDALSGERRRADLVDIDCDVTVVGAGVDFFGWFDWSDVARISRWRRSVLRLPLSCRLG